MELEYFQLLRPWWLVGLIAVAIMGYRIWASAKQKNGWAKVIDPHLLKHLMYSQDQIKSSPLASRYWFLLGLILAILAMSGPTFEKRPLPVFETEVSKVILLDLSMSMLATDVEPSRLTRAKYKINDILNQSKEGQTALIVYAGDAFVISPLTTDSKTITTLVPPLSPTLMPVLGSQPAAALSLANELLANSGVISGQIIWITDGVDDNDYLSTRRLLENSMHQVSILAVGTEEGAPIPLPDGQGFLKEQGKIVVPSLNYATLEELAKAGKGSISQMTASDNDIKYLMSQLKTAQEFIASEDDLEMDTWVEFGPWLLLIVLIITSLAFRRGLVFSLLVLVFPAVHSPTVKAEEQPPTPVVQETSILGEFWDNLWLTPNQQAQRAFNSNQHNQAATLFEAPDWKSAALYRGGQYQAAVSSNLSAEDATAWYNRGNALAKAGEYQAAIGAYNQALEKQPEMDDALFNKKLVEDLLKQQQEDEQQEQQQNEDQDQNKQQNQDNASDQEQSSEQQENQDQQQQSQEQSEQQKQQEQEMKELEQMSDEEKQQVLEQWLRQIKDDPGGLLRRKMYMEYQKRKQQNQRLQEKGEKSW